MAWLNHDSTKSSTAGVPDIESTLPPTDGLRAPFAAAVNAAYWARMQKWEDEDVKPPGSGHPLNRGEWVNALLDSLLSICENHGYSARPEQEQQLRDELFDYIKSVSY